MTTTICVDNEYQTLQMVAVHAPGEEIARMRPEDFSKSLFDDLLSPNETMAEHAVLTDLLTDAGAQVVQVHQLLVTAIQKAPAPEREKLISRAAMLAGNQYLGQELLGWKPKDLADALIHGLPWSKVRQSHTSLARLGAQFHCDNDMAFQPMANLMFMRDPCIPALQHLIPSKMAYSARSREPILVPFALRWGLGIDEKQFVHTEHHPDEPANFSSFEGGDFLILSPQVLMVGASQRTSPQAIERIAQTMMALYPSLERIYAVLMPENRSMMHLDTLLTQIDERHFLGHMPLITGQGHVTPLPVAVLERNQNPRVVRDCTVHDVLRDEIDPDVRMIACGGDDPIHQAREQWTDGANGLCLAPGHVVLYSRNQRTIRVLEDLGFEEVRLSAVQSRNERRDLVQAAQTKDRVVYSLTGSELSRARGGARCLTMPLRRQSMD